MKPEEVKKIRLSRNQSQEEFAHSIGTTRLTVSNWENGKHKPSKVFVRNVQGLK